MSEYRLKLTDCLTTAPPPRLSATRDGLFNPIRHTRQPRGNGQHDPGLGRKGAGILRHKPNVKWGKDRGKEPGHHKEADEYIRPRKDFPWFWSCPGGGSEQQRTDFQGGPAFDGGRWNDMHYTRAAKEAVRAASAGGRQ